MRATGAQVLRLASLSMWVSGFALLSVGCAGSWSTASEACALKPRATVAVVGHDVLEFVAPVNTGDEALAGVESAVEGEASLHLVADDAAGELAVEVRGVERVTVHVTSVTLGEALAFLAGGRLVRTPDLVRILTLPGGSTEAQRRHVALEGLAEGGTGLLTVVAEGVSGANVLSQQRWLLQMGRLALEAERDAAGSVRVELHDRAGAPIGGAPVELVDADGRVLSTAQTALDGTALLEPQSVRPSPRAVLGPTQFVVASVGETQALVALP